MVTFEFEIHTPTRLFFSGAAAEVVVNLADGEIGILKDHHRFTSPVKPGIVRIKAADGSWKKAFSGCGIVEVKKHKTVLLTDAAEWPSEIDVARAVKVKADAERVIREVDVKIEREDAKKKLVRAALRLSLASKSEPEP
jgi:F-type H+-transporting ATPase subunit epsilon